MAGKVVLDGLLIAEHRRPDVLGALPPPPCVHNQVSAVELLENTQALNPSHQSAIATHHRGSSILVLEVGGSAIIALGEIATSAENNVCRAPPPFGTHP